MTEPTRIVLAKGQPVPNDPYLYTNTVLLLHGDGTNGSTTILDSSKVAGSPKTVTPVGNAQISTAIADPFGNSTRGVLAFDGTGDYLTVPSNAGWAFATNDFTFETWVYRLSSNRQMIMATGSQGFFIAINTSGNIEIGRALLAIDYTFTASIASNVWTFISVQRAGTTLSVFKDGVSLGTATNSTNWPQGILYIGIDANATTTPFNGYIDDLRITKGVARYTANFPVPTAPFPDF